MATSHHHAWNRKITEANNSHPLRATFGKRKAIVVLSITLVSPPQSWKVQLNFHTEAQYMGQTQERTLLLQASPETSLHCACSFVVTQQLDLFLKFVMPRPALAFTHISPRTPRALHIISGWQTEGSAIVPKVTQQASQGAEERSRALGCLSSSDQGRTVTNAGDKRAQKGH